MKKKTLQRKIWIGALAAMLFFCFGIADQAFSKEGPEAVAKASILSGPAPLMVQFNGRGSSAPDGKIAGYKWDFGDGKTSSRAVVNHVYREPGDYVATLTVTDKTGASDQDVLNIEVHSRYIHVENIAMSLLPDGEDAVKAKAVVTVTDEEKNPVEWVLVVGKWSGLVRGRATGLTDADGRVVFVSESTGKTGTIKFKIQYMGASGYVYKPSQNKVRKASIATDSEINMPPEVNIYASTVSGPAPLAVKFGGVDCSDPDGEIVSYLWDFGDGETAEGEKAMHTYESAGTYNATLTLTDDQGATSSTSVVIAVTVSEEPPAKDPEEDPTNQKPVPAISAALHSAKDVLTIDFSGENSYDPDGTVETYEWDFGDGAQDVGSRITHTYAALGNYYVTLSVTDDKGAVASTTIALEINESGICYYTYTGGNTSGPVKK